MSLVTLFLVVVIVGVALYLVNRYVPMEANVKKLLNIAVIVFLLIWIIVSFINATGIETPDLRID